MVRQSQVTAGAEYLGVACIEKWEEIGMPQVTLSDFVEKTAAEFKIPGVAVGVWADGKENYVCHGVTSVENPLPVDRDTLYIVGSVTKTYTATTLMCLVAEGRQGDRAQARCPDQTGDPCDGKNRAAPG